MTRSNSAKLTSLHTAFFRQPYAPWNIRPIIFRNMHPICPEICHKGSYFCFSFLSRFDTYFCLHLLWYICKSCASFFHMCFVSYCFRPALSSKQKYTFGILLTLDTFSITMHRYATYNGVLFIQSVKQGQFIYRQSCVLHKSRDTLCRVYKTYPVFVSVDWNFARMWLRHSK